MSLIGANFSTARVLIVDDEHNVAALMKSTLNAYGISSSIAISAEDASRQLINNSFDLVVLDIGLPDFDGFSVLSRMRTNGHEQPVLFVTARQNPTDRIDGLRLGAEDYIVKPFDVNEFATRVQVCLRRLPQFHNQRRLRFGQLQIDINSQQVWISDEEIRLTPTEFCLLELLAVNAGRVVTRQELFDAAWFPGFAGKATLLDANISVIRKKLGADENNIIRTNRGIGYTLLADL